MKQLFVYSFLALFHHTACAEEVNARLLKKWARAKMGRELVQQSSALSKVLTTSTLSEAENTHDVTTTQSGTAPTTTTTNTTTSATGRIIQLDFSPVLKFDNPISKYIGRHLFRSKQSKAVPIPASDLSSSTTAFFEKFFSTTPAPTDLNSNSNPPRKTTRRLPKRFQGLPPPMVLKMATKSPTATVPLLNQSTTISVNHPSNLNPLSPVVNSFAHPPQTTSSSANMSAIEQYPPSKVLFSEKNSTKKFEIKLWDTIPFVEGRETPSEGLICFACHNELTHEACNTKTILCNKSQKASCMIEIRSAGEGQPDLISKGCKQVSACISNNQNPNSQNCCCESDECNRNGTTCANDNLDPIILKSGKTIKPKWNRYHTKTEAKWGPWLNWSGCSQICGNGIRRRRRVGYGPGSNFEEDLCNTQPCLDGQDPSDLMAAFQNKVLNFLESRSGTHQMWQTWENWGPCGTKCGRAYRERKRGCPASGTCHGSNIQRVTCTAIWGCKNNNRAKNLQDIQSQFTPWSEWSECSHDCGIGKESRKRECIASRCKGFLEQTRNCNTAACDTTLIDQPTVQLKSVAGEWSNWHNWSHCTQSCDGGKRVRSRDCVGGQCPGMNQESSVCNDTVCARWSAWTDWTVCSISCNGGISTRDRLCTGVGECAGESLVQKSCNTLDCPTWNPWTEWSECSEPCGKDGVVTRTRNCSVGDGCSGSPSEERTCSGGQCASWSNWSNWAQCDSICGGGVSTSNRICTGVGECAGDPKKERVCNSFKCAGWSNWAPWSHCSAPCGTFGIMRRNRECEGTGECTGLREATDTCNMGACASWDDWGEWGSCSAECGGGEQSRLRGCTGIGECQGGNDTESKNCGTESCAHWLEWNDYGTCSVSCGTGERQRQRECVGLGICAGSVSEIDDCSYGDCAEWSAWEDWSSCSKSCGDGISERTRECFGLGDCTGDSTSVQSCNLGGCAKWAIWGSWGLCSASCDIGSRNRVRVCEGLGDCIGEVNDTDNCNTETCAYWASWNDWNPCSQSCGEGMRSRDRSCLGKGSCIGLSDELERCDDGQCASWADWANWQPCSASCDGGFRFRERNCLGLGKCHGGDAKQKGICNLASCAVYGMWNAWGACTATCSSVTEDAIQSRNRDCLIADKCGRNALTEAQKCPGSPPCPIWSDWSDFSTCSETCGDGVMQKMRECLYGDECEGDEVETAPCSEGQCPFWSEWLNWNTCSATCGDGTTIRNRICKFGQEEDCQGDSAESDTCNIRACPNWATWESWNQCTKTCGTGSRIRNRECSHGEPGTDCVGNTFEETDCNAEECPMWGKWNEWNNCNASCGTGLKTRRRRCKNGEDCPGDGNEKAPCNTRKCPIWAEWNSWASCSQTCGGGNRQKSRACLYGIDCEGDSVESDKCATEQCPYWSAWSSWGNCSQSCGSGLETRNRECLEGDECHGNVQDSRECTLKQCPRWGVWAEWVDCPVTCGNSTQTRNRDCVYSVNLNDCNGLDANGSTDVQDCQATPCPYWAEWAAWNQCSKSCGGGRRRKARGCMHGPGCPGGKSKAFFTEQCNTAQCSFFEQWSHFDECSKPCGNGTQARHRTCNGPNCNGPTLESKNCNEHSCPTWSEWSDYNTCSKSCGTGEHQRNRQCLNANSSAECVGVDVENKGCNTNQCPTWTNWTKFSTCSTSCGRGDQSRTRICEGGVKGVDCIGADEDVKTCTVRLCPEWSDWSEFHECSKTCGAGVETRSRWCRNGQSKTDCEGVYNETNACNTQACPVWSAWSSFDECSETCGTGQQSRSRKCIGGVGGIDCIGVNSTVQNCNTNLCPIWSTWSNYSVCSQTCGGGEKDRHRSCLHAQSDSQCLGDNHEMAVCNENSCPKLGEWSGYDDCSQTCGGGEQRRTRQCQFGNARDCKGDMEQLRKCNSNKCPVWGKWGSYDSCSESCGGGVQTKTRGCQFGLAGVDCAGDKNSSRSCNDHECPVWASWSDYNVCSRSCGTGDQVRTRECDFGIAGTDCEGDAKDSRTCNTPECPIWASWSKFGECSSTCGTGSQSRNRECKFGTVGIDCLGASEDTRSCNSHKCPIWATWSGYEPCSKSCGSGNELRSRGCNFGIAGIDCVGLSEQNRLCNTKSCPIWASWSEYGDCSRTCGSGSQSRKRECDFGVAEIDCIGSYAENRTCNVQKCPKWSSWGEYDSCSKTCGRGEQWRARSCQHGVAGQDCIGAAKDNQTCNSQKCPIWATWSSYGACSASCGSGQQSRNRKCKFGESHQDCVGSANDTRICNSNNCPTWTTWSDYNQCSRSCGTGIQSRNRECPFGTAGKDCFGKAEDNRTCNAQACPNWATWSKYGACSATCGSGEQTRNRKCSNGIAGKDCTGSWADTRACNTQLCPSWAVWSKFDECSESCGIGFQSRSRTCRNGSAGTDCIGRAHDIVKCNTQQCPLWTTWSDYAKCSASCGTGRQARKRSCKFGKRAGDCAGEAEESKPCNTDSCAAWSTWSSFDKCTATCGGGKQIRHRSCNGGRVGIDCIGAASNATTCNAKPCPNWTTWSAYSTCSKSCGQGERVRTRTCKNGLAGRECRGRDAESSQCLLKPCPATYSTWSDWTECSATCGAGVVQSRSRECNGSKVTCKEKVNETQPCLTKPCSQWEEWASWSPCTVSCGGGMHYRDRSCTGRMCPGQGMQYARCATQECDAGCSGARDVLFLIHQTTYMGSTFDDISGFFQQIIEHINIEPSPKTIRFSLSLYNNHYMPYFDLAMLSSLADYKWAFGSIPKARGSQNYIGNALKYATESMSVNGGSGRRPATPGVVVLLTDSISSDSIQDAVVSLKGVVDRVIVVGMGYAYDDLELATIASYPTDKNLYEIEESRDLGNYVATVADEICKTEISAGNACATAGCQEQCVTQYSGAQCLCSVGSLGADGKSCSVTCVDELGQERQPGDTWDVDGLMGMSCTCLEGGDTDCSFGAGGFGNYGFGNYGW